MAASSWEITQPLSLFLHSVLYCIVGTECLPPAQWSKPPRADEGNHVAPLSSGLIFLLLGMHVS
ncbi:hypothetical protein LI328DRAFT_139437 [Trichoderma asperelloides]|nr:hypothetical protein LI328DRAFT_139437 [Trichoderma asperelloides]